LLVFAWGALLRERRRASAPVDGVAHAAGGAFPGRGSLTTYRGGSHVRCVTETWLRHIITGGIIMSLVDLMLKFASHTPIVGPEVNRIAINHFAASTVPRPRPYSLWSAAPADPKAPEYISDYTSWPSLTNKEF